MKYEKRPCNADDCNNWVNNPEICQKCIDTQFEINLFVGNDRLKKFPTQKRLVRQYRRNINSR